jgi:hypothetical protein
MTTTSIRFREFVFGNRGKVAPFSAMVSMCSGTNGLESSNRTKELSLAIGALRKFPSIVEYLGEMRLLLNDAVNVKTALLEEKVGLLRAWNIR